MKQVRKRLTYANVMSSIAVFLVLGGATAFAASSLGKNTVGSKQLKKNAVTAAKIKNGAVTGSKLKLSTIGKVPSAATADTAKSAATATTAGSAANATNAANADKVNGQTPVKIFTTIPNGTTGATIASFAGFTIRADCTGEDVENLVLLPPDGNSDLKAFGDGNVEEFFEDEQGAGAELTLNEENDRGETSFSAATSSGTVISGNIGYDDPNSFDSTEACAFYGEVVTG